MAQETAMDADEAIAALQSVRGYREGVTRQAAGLTWMVWGFVLAAIGFASQAAFLAGRHAGYHLGWVDPVMIVVMVTAGALVTRALYQLLAVGPARPFWHAWAFGGGAMLVLGGLVLASNALAPDQSGASDPALMMAPVVLFGSVVAATLTVLHRDTGWLPGALASTLLFAGFLNARFATFTPGPAADLVGNGVLNLLNLLTFLVVGWVVARRS